MNKSVKYIKEQTDFDPMNLIKFQDQPLPNVPYDPKTEDVRAKALRDMGIDPYTGKYVGQNKTQETISVKDDLTIGKSPVDFIDIMDFTKVDKFDKIYQSLQASDANSPAAFRKKQEENFKSVTGSIIGQLLIQSAQSSVVDSILPDNITLNSGVQVPLDKVKGYLKTAGNWGGGALAGSKVYDLVFGTSDYSQAASELNIASGQDAFGKYKTGDVTPEILDYELKTLSNLAAGPNDKPKSLSVVEKIFNASQPFKETGTPESEGPKSYNTPINLKDRVPEGFDFADEYNRFFGGAPSAPIGVTGGANAPRPTK